MTAAKPAAKKDGKVVPAVALSYQGVDIPMDTDLRELLPAELVEAVLERGEAKQA